MSRLMKRLVVAVLMLGAIPALASRKLTDEVGRRVTVPDHPHRIVCLAPSLTETVYALGDGDGVVGVTDYTTFSPGAQHKTSVGGLIDPSLEKIVSLRPDLILATKEVNKRETVEELERYRIPVYVVDPRGLSGILRSIRNIGAAIDRSRDAQELSTRLEHRWQTVASRVQGLRRPTILVVIWPDPVISMGKNTFISEVIHAAGAESATEDISQDWPRISMEEVVRRGPEFLLMGAHKGITVEQLKRQEGWKQLSAVQQNRIIYMDERMEHSSPVVFDALEELAKKLHPEAFSGEASR